MKSWDRFLKDVRPWAPGTAAPVAEHAVRRAAQDFCRLTRAWLVELDPIIVAADVTAYDLPLPDRAELVRLESATLGGQDLQVWRTETGRCRGRFVSIQGSRTAVLSLPSGDDVELVLTCAVRPGDSAPGVCDELFDLYSQDIAKGAVAGLLNDAMRRADFEQRCAEIRADLWRGKANTSPRGQAHFF